MGHKFIVTFFSRLEDSACQVAVSKLWDCSLQLFKNLGEDVNKASYEFSQDNNGIINHKLYDFNRSRRRVLSELERNNVRHFSFSNLPAGDNISSAFDWKVMVDCGRFEPMGLYLFQAGIDVGSLDSPLVTCKKTLNDVKSLAERYINPSYGYAYIMPSDFLPNGYSKGIMGSAPDELLYDANSWRRGVSAEFNTCVRNLHPVNFLNVQQLENLMNSGVIDSSFIFAEEHLVEVRIPNSLNDISDLFWDNEALVAKRRLLQDKEFFPWQSFFK